MGCANSKEVVDLGRPDTQNQNYPAPSTTCRAGSSICRTACTSSSDTACPCQCYLDSTSDPSAFEHILHVDKAAELFYQLHGHYTILASEIAKYGISNAVDQLEPILQPAFVDILHFCEVITEHFGDEKALATCADVVPVFTHITISFMNVKIIVEMYDMTLQVLEMGRSDWAATNLAMDSSQLSDSDSEEDNGNQQSSSAAILPRLRFRSLLETMDFHVAHIEAICKRVRDSSTLASQDLAQSTDVSRQPTPIEHSILSQHKANQRIIEAIQKIRERCLVLKNVEEQDWHT